MKILQTHQLTLKIANKIICQDLNLDIEAGDIWGILGPNGSGKTTLLHSLAGLLQPTQGNIYLEEKNLYSIPRKTIAQHLGILLQDTHPLFPQTVFEYCLAGRHPHLSYFGRIKNEDEEIAQQALRIMELDLKMQQNIFNLSGGERRRLAIAALLTQNPNIYLLDEPNNHLDLRHQIKVLNHFKHLTEIKPAAVVMSLHDLHLAKNYCNKILMLFSEGKILQGNSKELLNSENVSQLYEIDLQQQGHPF